MQDELQDLLRKTEEGLRQLPKPPSNDAFAEVLHVVSDFCRDLAQHLEGTPEESGLLQALQPSKRKFRAAIRETAPDFRPYKRQHLMGTMPSSSSSSSLMDIESDFALPGFLAHEEAAGTNIDESKAIYVDEVMDRASKYVATVFDWTGKSAEVWLSQGQNAGVARSLPVRRVQRLHHLHHRKMACADSYPL